MTNTLQLETWWYVGENRSNALDWLIQPFDCYPSPMMKKWLNYSGTSLLRSPMELGKSALNGEVTVFHRANALLFALWNTILDWARVTVMVMWPYYWGDHKARFHCTSYWSRAILTILETNETLLSVPFRACDCDRKVPVMRSRRLGAISGVRYQQMIGCFLPECHAKRWIIASLSLSGHPESAHRRSVDIDEGCTSLTPTVHCRRPYLGLRDSVATVISCEASWVRR